MEEGRKEGRLHAKVPNTYVPYTEKYPSLIYLHKYLNPRVQRLLHSASEGILHTQDYYRPNHIESICMLSKPQSPVPSPRCSFPTFVFALSLFLIITRSTYQIASFPNIALLSQNQNTVVYLCLWCVLAMAEVTFLPLIYSRPVSGTHG